MGLIIISINNHLLSFIMHICQPVHELLPWSGNYTGHMGTRPWDCGCVGGFFLSWRELVSFGGEKNNNKQQQWITCSADVSMSLIMQSVCCTAPAVRCTFSWNWTCDCPCASKPRWHSVVRCQRSDSATMARPEKGCRQWGWGAFNLRDRHSCFRGSHRLKICQKGMIMIIHGPGPFFFLTTKVSSEKKGNSPWTFKGWQSTIS